MLRTMLAVVALSASIALAQQAPAKIDIGDKVPDFSVTDLNGMTWKLSDIQKLSKFGVVSLTFWCTFCGSCRHIDRDLDKLAKDFEKRATVLALDASAGETSEKVRAFARQKELTMPVALDAAGQSADLFGVKLTTTTVIIDGQGVLRYRGQFGHGDHAYAAEALKSVLAGQEVRVKETRHMG